MSKTNWLSAAPMSATNSKADTPLHPFLVKLMRGENLSETEAAEFFSALIAENANQAQIAGSLVALAAKGETAAELAGIARVMREKSVKITSRQTNFIDTAGTGSSLSKTFNVSTAAAFVIAGAGLSVAKHGNRAVTSRTGSADVLEKLGVKVSGDLLGPLSNPANAPKQIVGVWHQSLIKPMAKALALLGTESAWVVHGSDGLDEITVTGETEVAGVSKKTVKYFTVEPQSFGLKRGGISHLQVKTPDESAKIIFDILASKRRDEARSLVVMNAAAALVVGGVAKDLMHAARLAEQSIDSGQAQNKLERLIQATNK
jgi:anthranilate phosphoribosyltransferase